LSLIVFESVEVVADRVGIVRPVALLDVLFEFVAHPIPEALGDVVGLRGRALDAHLGTAFVGGVLLALLVGGVHGEMETHTFVAHPETFFERQAAFVDLENVVASAAGA
jgi:hypothetical protein